MKHDLAGAYNMNVHKQEMRARCYLQTGQMTYHDTAGREIICQGSGQDAEFRKGGAWPVPRFEQNEEGLSTSSQALNGREMPTLPNSL